MPEGPDSLAAFIERGPVRDLSIAVVNRTRPQPIQEMVEETFGGRSIGGDELDVPDAETDQVVVLDGDDVVATSPLAVLEDEILLVNSDLYMTGTKALGDVTLPDVFANLDETPFRVQGYPASGSEKLPLIMIERQAHTPVCRRGRRSIYLWEPNLIVVCVTSIAYRNVLDRNDENGHHAHPGR